MPDGAGGSDETQRPFRVTTAGCKVTKLFEGKRNAPSVSEIAERDECLRENAISFMFLSVLKHQCSNVDHRSRVTASIAQFLKRCQSAVIRTARSIEITQFPLEIAETALKPRDAGQIPLPAE